MQRSTSTTLSCNREQPVIFRGMDVQEADSRQHSQKLFGSAALPNCTGPGGPAHRKDDQTGVCCEEPKEDVGEHSMNKTADYSGDHVAVETSVTRKA